MDLDEILDEVGHFGKYQAINYFLVGVLIILSSVYGLSYVFTAGDLEYRCHIPECDAEEATFHPVWLHNAVPFQQSHPSRCLRFTPCNNTTSTHLDVDEMCPSELFNQNNTIRCHNWIYDGRENTIVNEWDITCVENAWKLALVGTVNNIGQFIGFPLAGYVSDRIGRKTALVLSTVGAGVMGIARSLAWSYESFLAFEFLDPVLGAGVYPSGFILGMELVGPSARVLGSTVISVFYTLGEVMLGLVALWLQNWRNILRVFYIPALFCIAFRWLLPESVRWLLAMKKTKEAREIILKAAKTNGVTLSAQTLEKFEDAVASEEKPEETQNEVKSSKHIVMQILRSKILMLRVVNCSFCWITITFVFYGLSLTSVTVDGNKFTNFIWVALIELPAYCVFYFTMDKFGRKTMLCSSLVLSGISCISFAFIPTGLDWLRLVLFLLGKFAITISFTVVYVYTAEFFPTELRQSLLGVCAMFGRIGSITAPQTPLLEKYMESLPLLLFGGMSILSGFLSLFFPETLNVKLPDTIEEAENIGRKTS